MKCPISFAVTLALGLGLSSPSILSASGQNKAATPATDNPELFAQLMTEGAAAFPNTCAACHGPEAGGKAGPALRQNVMSARGVVKTVANGRGAMPPVGGTLTDREIAAIATYVRNSWGNEYGLVTEEEVQKFRKPVVY